MPPFKRLPKSQVAATEQGLAPMAQFFKPKIKPGRPSRASSKAGRKAAPKDPAAAPAAKLPGLGAQCGSLLVNVPSLSGLLDLNLDLTRFPLCAVFL